MSGKNARLYIAYGSNLNIRRMKKRCPTAKVVGAAELKGYELLFRGGTHSSVATVEPAGGKCVPVLLWDIRPADEAALDWYEGVPHFYRKETLAVERDGRTLTAMAYVMTDGHMAGLPSQGYLDIIAEGYRSAGFDTDVLRQAMRRSLEVAAAKQTAWASMQAAPNTDEAQAVVGGEDDFDEDWTDGPDRNDLTDWGY
jgi:hypothetical protein